MIQKENISPTMLIILDGFGYKKEILGNAINSASMPNLKFWLKKYPTSLLHAAGKYVGLPEGYIGNSEVGHTCIGCGRIVETVLAKFHESIKNGSFFKNTILLKNFEKLKTENSTLHLIGLLSNAGVHSHQEHLYAFIQLAKNIGIQKILIHPILDGRDTPPQSAIIFLQQLQDFCSKINCGKIASIHGRFYAMDRDNNWERTQISYDILTAERQNTKTLFWKNILEESYKNQITDEFLNPTLLLPDGIIKKNDGIIFFNFRADRARQLTESFINPKFKHFPTKNLNSTQGSLSFFISTTRYKEEFEHFSNEILFEKEKIEHTLLDEIAGQIPPKNNNQVFVIAETEKYAHVTYFFRGMIEKKLPNESYHLIPSIKAKDYVNLPEMSADKITSTILQSLQENPARFYLINFANADMVGHSGNFEATVKACEFIDKQLKPIYEEVVEKQNGTIFLTSDHGNAEEKIDYLTKKPLTAHTQNPVIFMVLNKNLKKDSNSTILTEPQNGLANIAPTILKHLGLKIPKEMKQKTIF